MPNPGEIRNREYIKQIYNYSGLNYGTISPTDIDVFFDFGKKIFIIIEIKYKDKDLPAGQKLALERLCDVCQKGGVNSYFLILSHDNKNEDIDCFHTILKQVRYKYKWFNTNKTINLNDAILFILKKHNYKIPNQQNKED